MSRVAYIGGFGNGRGTAERVGEALQAHFEDVDVFTFSDFVRSPETVQNAMKGVDLVTHSAGALALAEASSLPRLAHLFNPPLPSSIGGLLDRTLIKTARMNTPGVGIHRISDVPSVAHYSASSVAELAVHPLANLGQLRRIAHFDAIDTAIQARSRGVYSRISWTLGDTYFQPSQKDMSRAFTNAIPVAIFEGEHDEIALRPVAHLDQVFNRQ